MSGTFEFKPTDTVKLCETAEGALQVIEQLRGGAKIVCHSKNYEA